MNISQTITAQWWPTSYEGPVIEDHRELLQAEALEQAGERIRDGYREGELTCGIDDATGANYRGYWSVSTEEPAPSAEALLREALLHITDKPWDDPTFLHKRISEHLGLPVSYPDWDYGELPCQDTKS